MRMRFLKFAFEQRSLLGFLYVYFWLLVLLVVYEHVYLTLLSESQIEAINSLLDRLIPQEQTAYLLAAQVTMIGLLFPIDVIYLDAVSRVIHASEHLKPFRVTSFRRNCHSVLDVPIRTIFESETEVGDQITISRVSELEEETGVSKEATQELEASARRIMVRLAGSPATAPPGTRPSAGPPRAPTTC